MRLVTKNEALRAFTFQYYFGILFALVGTAICVILYLDFRDSGVPVAGSSERLDPLFLAVVFATVFILFGAALSLVVRPAIRRLRAEIRDERSGA